MVIIISLCVDLKGECTMIRIRLLSERVITSACTSIAVAGKLALIEWEVVRGKPRSVFVSTVPGAFMAVA